MKIVIAGGSGFIGQKLTDLLLDKGHEIIILTRNEKTPLENIRYIKWLESGTFPEKAINHADVFINLAGVSINAGRWNENHQKRIYESRMDATEELLRIVSALPEKPSVLVNASAIGIYPPSLHAVYGEDSVEKADDFLGKTVCDWENKAKQAEAYGIRVVMMRFGVILGKEAGALPLMTLPYKLFAGGKVGSGKQWVSWIHMTDVVRAVSFVIEQSDLHGPVNVTAPNPMRMEDFGRGIGAVLNRPHWLPVPSFVMKLVLGKKSALVLEGQHVVPAVLLEKGYSFMFPSFHSALEDLLINR